MLNVRDLIRIVWRHKFMIALIAAVALAAAAYFAFTTPEVYEAEALVRVDRSSNDIGEALAALSVSQRLAQTYARIVTTRSLAGKVAERLGSPHTTLNVLGALTAQQVENLDLLRIRAKNASPEEAARVANATAAVLKEYVEEVSADTQGERLLIVDPAVPPRYPAGPSPSVVMIVAFAAGLSLGVGFVLVLDYFEDRIVDNDEIESMTGLPILGVIPVMHGGSEGK
ncbi:MAG: YveK family protein [Thermoleophilia bacterium]